MSTTILNRGTVRGEFTKALALAERQSLVSRLSLSTRSSVASERYAFGDSVPIMTPFRGVTRDKQIGAKSIDLVNEEFRTSIDMSSVDLDRDQTGTLRRRMSELAQVAAYHPWLMIQDLILGNTSFTCYDGVSLFSSSHSHGSSGTQTNDLSSSQVATLDIATASAPTPEEAAQFISDVIAYMMGYKNDEGLPMHETASQFVVLTPFKHMGSFTTALRANNLAGSRSNPLSLAPFSVDVFPGGKLTTNTVFYVARVDAESVRPFIYQVEQDPTLDIMDQSSDYYKLHKRVKALVDCRMAVGVAEPLSIVKCTMS